MTRFTLSDRVLDAQGTHRGNLYTLNEEIHEYIHFGLKIDSKKPRKDVIEWTPKDSINFARLPKALK